MNLLPGTATKTFSLLSIGQRGVGKTVFLVGSYAELHSGSQTNRQQELWFDCQDSRVQANIENILGYIARTGQYPPLTMKVTSFNFNLKRHSLWGIQTLCHFRWWDIPGEICDVHNSDFKAMVFASHGCCVLIDAYALVHKPAYRQALEEIIQQVMAIASLVYLNGLKYAFALILTKCDLLEPDLLSQQRLEEGLQQLTTRLDQVRVNYEIFYSLIPIVDADGASALKAKGAAAPILWLVWELSKAHEPKLKNNLLEWVTRLVPSHSQPQQNSVDGLAQNLHRASNKASGVKKELGLYLLPNGRRTLWLLILAIVGTLGVTSLLVDYKWFFQPEPSNFDALSKTAPEHLNLRLQQAQSYETVGQLAKAEALYDQVLAEQSNNLNALVSKAVLRHAQGDAQMAETLFAQAEKAAPNDLKAQVRAVARKTLQTPAKPVSSPK